MIDYRARQKRINSSYGFAVLPSLLKINIKMPFNMAFKTTRSRKVWTLVGIVGTIFMMLELFTFSSLGFADPSNLPNHAQLSNVVARTLVLLFGFAGGTSVPFVLGAYYSAKDVDSFLLSPTPPRVLILSKLINQMVLGIAIGSVLVGPVLLSYLVTQKAALVLPLILLIAAVSVLMVLSIATMVTIWLVRIIPTKSLGNTGGIVVGIMGIIFFAFNIFLKGSIQFNISPFSNLNQDAGITNSMYLPTGWASRSIVALIEGRVVDAILWSLPILTVSLFLLWMASVVCESAYTLSYQQNSELGAGARKARASLIGFKKNVIHRPWVGILIKDILSLKRDTAYLAQLIFPITICAVYTASPGGLHDLANFPVWYGPALTSCFATLFVASGLALRAVGLEGPRMWILKSSPVKTGSILLAKFTLSWLIGEIMGVGLLWLGIFGNVPNFSTFFWSSLQQMIIVTGLISMAIGLGAMKPKLDWTDPRRAVGLLTGFGYLALGGLYIGIVFVILTIPFALKNASLTLPFQLAAALFAITVSAAFLSLGSASLKAKDF